MTTVILIRHGETDWNIEGRYQGQADPPLNSKGVRQAHFLAREISQTSIDLFYSSPLKRAYETAKILAESLNVPLYRDARLMEIHQGEWQTKLRSEISALYPDLFRLWETKPWDMTPPGGESLTQVQKRVYSAVDDIVVNHQGECIGLVTHQIPIILLKIRYEGLDLDEVRTLHLSNVFWESFQLEKENNE